MLTLNVVATLTEPMLGTVPKNREIYTKYIESEKIKRADQEAGTNEAETVPVDENKGWTGFHSDEQGLFVYDYLIKGALKNAANVLKDSLKQKNLRSKFDNCVFVFPRKVRILGDQDAPLMKPDGIVERPLRAMTMQGPRVTLARSDSVNVGRKMRFEIRCIETDQIKEMRKTLDACMEYWQLCGFGQFRNGSYGRATVEVE